MKPIERIRRTLSYEGAILRVYTDHVRLPNGKESDWDFIEHMGAAAVVPVLPDGRILLVRQYRNALDRFTLELPAGKLDYAEEPPIECAARELEEETGYHSDHLTYLMTMNTWLAFCNEKVGIYVARNLVKTERHLDEEEDIETEAHEIEELIGMIRRGELTDAKTTGAILAYSTYGEELL